MNGFEKKDFDPAETEIEKKLFFRKSVTKSQENNWLRILS